MKALALLLFLAATGCGGAPGENRNIWKAYCSGELDKAERLSGGDFDTWVKNQYSELREKIYKNKNVSLEDMGLAAGPFYEMEKTIESISKHFYSGCKSAYNKADQKSFYAEPPPI